jgi:hypothetical protein
MLINVSLGKNKIKNLNLTPSMYSIAFPLKKNSSEVTSDTTYIKYTCATFVKNATPAAIKLVGGKHWFSACPIGIPRKECLS